MILPWLWLATVAMVTAIAALRRARHVTPWDDDDHPLNLIVLRPCTGNDAFLQKSLATWPEDAAHVSLRYLVPTADDPVYAIAERAAVDLQRRGIDAEVVLTGTVTGAANRKVAQLAAVDLDPYDAVCVLDADLDLHATRLADLVVPLRDAAAAWLPPTEHGGATFGDRASSAVLAGSLHAFPLLAGIDPRGLVGKAFAVRCDALNVVGGFESFTTRLGEDVELAYRLLGAGYEVVPAVGAVVSLARGRTFNATIQRFARWLTVIRAQRPMLLVSYPMLFFASLPLLVWFAIAGSLSGLIATLCVRAVTAFAASRYSGAPARVVADALVADFVLLIAWVLALCSRRVRWRGVSFRIDQHGHLVDG